jgi:DNA anti-recombination protein RmuC
MLAGSMVGLLAGPVGLAVGASIGSLTGLIADLSKSGIDVQFVDDVSKALSAGKAAVLADVEETWTAPVDARVGKLGGIVFRRLRYEVAEDQLAREAAAFEAEAKQLKEELAQAHADNKAAIQAQIDAARSKAKVMQDQAKARIDQATREADAKLGALQAKLKQASDRRKEKIEKRIAEVKADLGARRSKLQEAGRLAKEALAA